MSYQGAEVMKSLSNLIKHPFVNMNGKEAVVINNNEAVDKFIPFRDKRVKIRTIGEIEAEKAMLQATDMAQEGDSDDVQSETGEFKAGLNVTNFDKLFYEHQKKAESKADEMLAEAREQAEQIKNEAHIASEAARNRGFEEGRELGYQEGMALAEQEIHKREEELAESARQQQREIQECLASVEEKYVDVVISLVKKLTGVVIEGKEDLILHLIRTAANDLDSSETYRIRVSPEDIYFLEGHRGELSDSLGRDVFLEFVEEKGLEKGQCIIETDSQMADCGFQTQMESLINDLKMLVR